MYKILNPIPLSPFYILILILNICYLNLSTFYSIKKRLFIKQPFFDGEVIPLQTEKYPD